MFFLVQYFLFAAKTLAIRLCNMKLLIENAVTATQNDNAILACMND